MVLDADPADVEVDAAEAEGDVELGNAPV